MKHAICLALGLGLLASGAQAAITVNSTLDNTASLVGIRAQAVITDPTGLTGAGFEAIAIKQITASLLIRDGVIQNGIAVNKRQLSAQQAYGLQLPLGYNQPPFTDPEGPWFGLTWPYRDQYDYFPGQFDPLADDVGIPFEDQPGVYGYVNIAGIARGGPTDEVPAPGSNAPEWLDRGVTGNGLDGPATYFQFDIEPLSGPLDRFVRIQIFGASAIVVQRDKATGEYSELLVQIPDFTTDIPLPEPGIATTAGLLGMLMLGRRRGRDTNSN